MVTKCNFWLGGPILKIRVPKQVPRRRKNFLCFSQILIGRQLALVFAKTFGLNQFFANAGSKWGPIEIWLKYKTFSRLLSTCLGTLILKIGPHVQKLHCLPSLIHPYLCRLGFFRSQKNQIDKKWWPSVTFERMDRFWKFECLNRCQGGEKHFCISVKFRLDLNFISYLRKYFVQAEFMVTKISKTSKISKFSNLPNFQKFQKF